MLCQHSIHLLQSQDPISAQDLVPQLLLELVGREWVFRMWLSCCILSPSSGTRDKWRTTMSGHGPARTGWLYFTP